MTTIPKGEAFDELDYIDEASFQVPLEALSMVDIPGVGITRVFHLCNAPDPSVAEKVVFLHGFNFFIEMYAVFLNAATTKYDVLCIDLPGHGESAPQPKHKYPVSCFVDAVVGAVNHVGWSEARMHLAGHSMGGLLVPYVAEDKRLFDRIISCTLIAPAGIKVIEDKDSKFLRRPIAGLVMRMNGIAKLFIKKAMRDRSWPMMPKKLADRLCPRFEQHLSKYSKKMCMRVLDQGRHFPWGNSHEAFRTLSSRKNIRVHLVIGTVDMYVDVEATRRFMEKNVPHCDVVVVEGMTHDIPLIAPRLILKAVASRFTIDNVDQ